MLLRDLKSKLNAMSEEDMDCEVFVLEEYSTGTSSGDYTVASRVSGIRIDKGSALIVRNAMGLDNIITDYEQDKEKK